MENEQIQYQVKKTIRMGLTLVEKKTFDKNSDKIPKEVLYQSHSILKDLVQKSEEKILKLEKCKFKKEFEFSHENLVKQTDSLIKEINKFLQEWRNIIYIDTNFLFSKLEFTKDYFIILSKKARFDYIKQNKSKIKLNAKETQKEIMNKIIDYWKDNSNKLKNRIEIFEKEIKKYNTAINTIEAAHTKPNLVEFRKQCLGILNLVNNILNPIKYLNINIIEIIPILINKNILKESTIFKEENKLKELFIKIEQLKIILNENGGYNQFGKASFNKFTVTQKPHNYSVDIKDLLEKTGILELLKALKNEDIEPIKEYFYFKNINKKIEIFNTKYSIILRAQMYKPHPIKEQIIQLLPDFIASNYDENFNPLNDKEKKLNLAFSHNIRELLSKIGNPINIGEEYINYEKSDKLNDFNLNNYPLKLAFNYAWELLAQSVYNDKISFDKNQCKEFLKENFDVSIENNEDFTFFSQLLHLQSLISNIEYCNIKEEKLYNISKIIESINTELINSPSKLFEANYDNKNLLNLKKIIERLNILITNKDWIKFIKENSKIDNKNKSNECAELKLKIFGKYILNDFNKAKQEFGFIRGNIKTKIIKYNNLSTLFKSDYMNTNKINLGKLQAELRDKLNEENNLNKIEYFSVLLEDKNKDTYILLCPINYKQNIYSNTTEIDTSIIDNLDTINDNDGEIIKYSLKTFTSKTLHKIINNLGGYDKNESNKKPKFDNINVTITEYYKLPNFINWLKIFLKKSEMSKIQNWSEFGWNFDNCDSLEKIYKEVDFKSYIFKKDKKISIDKIKDYINNNNSFLLPIINQDLINKNKENVAKNQFTKDWENILKLGNKEHRLHPEFNVSFRHPTKDYPNPNEKRYSRFQLIGYFGYDIIPDENHYYNIKDQIEIFNNKKNNNNNYNINETQEEHVIKVNKIIENNIKKEKEFYIVSIDRGLKRLGVLCILNQNGEIEDNHFDIYTRCFDKVNKQWKHAIYAYKKDVSFLDLSNLKVETTIDGDKVLVDLSTIKVHNNKIENQQKIKLRQLAYLRELQNTMSVQYGSFKDTDSNTVLQFYKKYLLNESEGEKNFANLLKCDCDNICYLNSKKENRCQKFNDILADIRNLLGIVPFVEGKHYESLTDCFNNDPNIIYTHLKLYYDNINEYEILLKTIELYEVENYKKGIVANMIGVINFIVNEYFKNYNVIIAMEDLTKSYWYMIKGIDPLNKHHFEEEEFKENTNIRMAGLGLYHFFEMQLLKKLFKIQRERNILMIPSFRAESDFEKIINPDKNNGKNSEVFKFGIVNFVNPSHTSKCCPNCGTTKGKIEKLNKKNELVKVDIVIRDGDQLTCSNCNYNLKEYINNKNTRKNNLPFITNADENAAYQIALKALINIKQK